MKKFDWPILFLAIFLSFIGLFTLYHLSFGWRDFSFFYKQTFFLITGIGLAIFFSYLNIRALKKSPYFVFFLYFISLILLVGLFFFAPIIRGTKAWYPLGGFTFGPVEIVKIVFLLFFAKYFSQRHVELYQVKHIILGGIYAFIPTTLVFFQPDFGSAMILLIIWFFMMLISGIKRKHILAIFVLGMICFFILWFFLLKPYQKERFLTFLNPYLDPGGSGYHIIQSIIAIGSGGFWGKGFEEPFTQAKLGFLPISHTDFIFASFFEMAGLLGAIVLFLFFGLFFWRVLKLAKKSQDNFSRLLISGFGILVGAEIFINLAMNLGILPITGISLPFLSYGGSGLLSLFIGIGIIESMVEV